MASSGRRIRLGTISDRWSVNYMLFLLLLNTFSFLHCSAGDTITAAKPLGDGETLVSAEGKFELGFFPPASSVSSYYGRYVGIWYKSDPNTTVWVANRDTPLLNYTSAVLAAKNGNLYVRYATGKTPWSTDLRPSISNDTTAQLLDNGNLVLSDVKTMRRARKKTIVWQSFEHPSDTFLWGMAMNGNLQLVSWKDQYDPARGSFTFKREEDENLFFIQNISKTHWSSKATGKLFLNDQMPTLVVKMLSSSNKKNGSIYDNKRVVMSYTGEIQYWSWDNKSGWTLIWKQPRDECSVFNACGNYGICNLKNDPNCDCLTGFKPGMPENWKAGDFAGGCVAEESKSCENNIFLNYTEMRVGKPDSQLHVENETACRNECDCQCRAYSYDAAVIRTTLNPGGNETCRIWRNDLSNLQEEYYGGLNLSVRVALSNKVGGGDGGLEPKSDTASRKRNQLILILVITIVIASLFLCAIVYLWRRNARKQEDSIQRNPVARRFDSERHAKNLIETSEFREEDKHGIDVPFFEFESIIVATNNFSDANKLGQGGYGPVYKGTFLGGQELAVKRLSSVSGQGLQEFKNEVVLIAKLQHRNLVKLWGYCVKGDEKILVYEYMPNRSLDAFVFDSKLAASLDWEMRFNIILGIARGLLYLHQDSRLRIIHRDMKTSNILLDEEMNPKISDFGLARIFGGKQNEANTNRVVGTYGYMAPEYALDGFFSVKSDVFSFGVVMLEIISGKRNTGFYRSQDSLSLLGYAWRFWEEADAVKLMDPTLADSCNISEFIKCMNVGLLCVQEEANVRPDMATVLVMLGSESSALPRPEQPAFMTRSGPSSSGIASSSTGSKTEIRNDLTNTFVEGR